LPDERLRPPPLLSNASKGFDLRAELLKHNRPVSWLAGITIVLIICLIFLPDDIRMLFWYRLQSQAILVSMLLIFSLVAISLVWSGGQKLDAWVFLTFNLRGRRPLWLDRIMLGFTQVGNGFTALALAAILFLFSERFLAYELLLGTLTLWLVVELVKLIVRRARPFTLLTQARIVGYEARGRSFPSGHTSQAFFMATLLIQHGQVGFWLAVLIFVLALLVGMTRIYVGAHYPRDVMAGAVLGSAWGLLGVIVEGVVQSGLGG
jgi:membrane-associated phospholipid phosphatase